MSNAGSRSLLFASGRGSKEKCDGKPEMVPLASKVAKTSTNARCAHHDATWQERSEGAIESSITYTKAKALPAKMLTQCGTEVTLTTMCAG